MERTSSDLQAQIDELNLTLRQWRDGQAPLPRIEERLAQLTDRCAEILNSWADTDHRHARAVSELEVRLGEWAAIEQRLEQDSIQRVREFQTTIEQEWKALRAMHEEPARQLQDQATALGETGAATANLAIRGFEQLETRLLALETDIRDRLMALAGEVRTALTDLDRTRLPAPAGAASAEPFPLEGVLRIHEELRAGGDGRAIVPSSGQPAGADPRQAALPGELVPVAALSGRVASLEAEAIRSELRARDAAAETKKTQRSWRLAVGLCGVAVVAAIVVGVVFARGLDTRVRDEVSQFVGMVRSSSSTADAATAQMAAREADTERQLAALRDETTRQGMTNRVLTAPDLVRLSLTGVRPATHASMKIFWSRSIGIVVTASDLPPVPDGSVYQVWWLSTTGPVSAGTFTPGPDGRAMTSFTNRPNLPTLVTGAIVTVEPTNGSPTAPSGPTLLTQR